MNTLEKIALKINHLNNNIYNDDVDDNIGNNDDNEYR